jgi:predicted nucleotidyltransferase
MTGTAWGQYTVASRGVDYIRRVSPTRDRDTLVRPAAAALPQDAPLRLAVLFGSAATGRTRPEGDFDVAILPDSSGCGSR